MSIKYLFFLILIFSLVSCKRDEKTFDQGYGYSPLNLKSYKIYSVQKIDYSILDTVYENYQIKEVVADTFTQGGRLKYRLERFKRLNTSEDWPFFPDSVWTAYQSESKLVRNENNVPYVKLVFPVEKGTSWDGNGENAYGKDEYTYDWKGKEFTVNNHYFSKTASVLQSGDSNLVNRDYRKEVYADGVGLIYKVQEIYDYQQTDDGQVKPGFPIDNGIKYYQKIESYGQE